jgi:bifunctional ADP-heptose synthase (sugar kinase/adenylyltransferase)
MLTGQRLEQILDAIPRLRIGVLGDLFLDRYLDIDPTLTELSLETGLDAYQVVRVRSCPGAAGTVINNLVALGVGQVHPVAIIGLDGEGFELQQALDALGVVDQSRVIAVPDRRTPTYTKPLVYQTGQTPRELNRLDIKNRVPLSATLEDRLCQALETLWPEVDALIVLDQVSEEGCGVVTPRQRAELTRRAEADPDRFVLADSRERIGAFRSVCLKPNEQECRQILGTPEGTPPDALSLSARCGRPVFCTRGMAGILLADAGQNPPLLVDVPSYPVTGPTDPVGAGDSTSAGIACAVAAGATLAEAAALGNLVASITVAQIGTTGTATPDQVRQRWQQVQSGR